MENNIFDRLDAEQQAAQMPYYVHEAEMYRMERLNKRWFIGFILVLLMLFATNGAWIIYEMGYETYYYQQDVSSDGADAQAFLNTGEGDVIYNEQSPSSGQNP